MFVCTFIDIMFGCTFVVSLLMMRRGILVCVLVCDYCGVVSVLCIV